MLYKTFFLLHGYVSFVLFVWRGTGTKIKKKKAAQVYSVEKVHNLQRGSETVD